MPRHWDNDIRAAFKQARQVTSGPPPGLEMPPLTEQGQIELEMMQRRHMGWSNTDLLGIAADAHKKKKQECSQSGKWHSSSQSGDEAELMCGW